MVMDVISKQEGSHGLGFICQFFGSVSQFVTKVCPTFLISLNGSHAKHLKAQSHLMNQFQNIEVMAIWAGNYPGGSCKFHSIFISA